MICEAVLIQYRKVIEGQTDGRTDRIAVSILHLHVSIGVLMHYKRLTKMVVGQSEVALPHSLWCSMLK